MEKVQQDKREKYRELTKKLKEGGWRVERHEIILGNMGGIQAGIK